MKGSRQNIKNGESKARKSVLYNCKSRNGGWETKKTAGASSREKEELSRRKNWMCRNVAAGEKKKETQKSKLSPIPRKLFLHLP